MSIAAHMRPTVTQPTPCRKFEKSITSEGLKAKSYVVEEGTFYMEPVELGQVIPLRKYLSEQPEVLRVLLERLDEEGNPRRRGRGHHDRRDL